MKSKLRSQDVALALESVPAGAIRPAKLVVCGLKGIEDGCHKAHLISYINSEIISAFRQFEARWPKDSVETPLEADGNAAIWCSQSADALPNVPA